MMGLPLDTPRSLLLRIRDRQDKASWSRFVELYAPLVYGFMRKRGVQDADATDLMQDVLMSVARAVDSFVYDPARGSFRRWLLTAVQNRLRNFWKRTDPVACGQGGTQAHELLLEQPEADNVESTDWDQAYERQLFQFAADQVRGDFQESTWLAFWRTAVEGQSPQAVADSLGLSVASTYMAKRRVLQRIKEQIAFLQGEPTWIQSENVQTPRG